MDINKISEQHILHIVMAVAAFSIAVAVRFICISSGCDTGTANLVFVIILGIEIVLYLVLMKVIINQVDKFLIRRRNKKEVKPNVIENTVSSEESV
jgi:nitrogen fixation/metabolism regulation signal transduction histidine kinase